MYNRPRYVKESDREGQRAAITQVSAKWPFDYRFESMPENTRVNYALYDRKRRLQGFAIVKCRKQSFKQINAWGGYELSEDKWLSAQELCEDRHPLALIVSFAGDVRYSYFLPPFPSLRTRMGGRSDRGDPNDRERMVVFPESCFLRPDEL